MAKTRNFGDVIRAELAADPELARMVAKEERVAARTQKIYDQKLEKALRTKLAWLLSGQIHLRDFHRWLAESTWDVNSASTASLRNLACGVKLRLAEYTGGYWTRDELETELRKFL